MSLEAAGVQSLGEACTHRRVRAHTIIGVRDQGKIKALCLDWSRLDWEVPVCTSLCMLLQVQPLRGRPLTVIFDALATEIGYPLPLSLLSSARLSWFS